MHMGWGSHAHSPSQTIEQIRRYYTAAEPYVVDPHTAVGLAATQRVIKNA